MILLKSAVRQTVLKHIALKIDFSAYGKHLLFLENLLYLTHTQISSMVKLYFLKIPDHNINLSTFFNAAMPFLGKLTKLFENSKYLAAMNNLRETLFQ